MRVGLCFDGFYSIREMLELAKLADRAGIESIWMSDHICFRDSVASAAAFLAATEKIRVFAAPLTPYSRHPMITAMAIATMEEMAPGRVGATIGTGNAAALAEIGVKVARPLRIMREYMKLLRQLLSGERVEFSGEFFTINGATMGFTPSSPVPIYMTAVKPGMLRLAGEIGDGVLLSAGCAPKYIERCVKEIEKGAARAGKTRKDTDVAGFITTSVSDNPREAVEATKMFLAYIFRNPHHAENIRLGGGKVDQEGLAAAVARRDWEAAKTFISDEVAFAHSVTGAPAECRARLQQFVREGLDLPILLPMGTPEARRRAVEMAKGL
ncbi:MAG TPA: LLM class flavin-dependent oxidoreductase [Candidatus Acidoferrales bacterium]|nr:LLM class flavin-dependent oxidoreductase [Candidatus Acidoferrales bacterium]